MVVRRATVGGRTGGGWSRGVLLGITVTDPLPPEAVGEVASGNEEGGS